jgi:subtilisin family serine protease
MDNSNRDNCRGPAPDISSLDTVVAVSATDRDDRKIDSSGHGPCLDFVAPSAPAARDAIATVDRPGEKGFNKGDNAEDFADPAYTSTFYGTSAAAPQVAAGFALLYDVQPELTREEALERMIAAADKVRPREAAYDPTSGRSRLYGHGRINLGRLLAPR